VLVVFALDGEQVEGVDLPFLVEVLLVAHYLHLHVSKTDVPHVEVAVNLLLQLSAQPEPHCKGAPESLVVDYDLEEVEEVVDGWVFRQHLHAQPLLLQQSSVEVNYFLPRFVDDQLEDVRIGHQDAALVDAHFEERNSESVLVFGVETFLLGEREALTGSQANPRSVGQFHELEQGRTVELISFDEFHQVGLEQFLPFLAVLHHIFESGLDGREHYFCVVREGLGHLVGECEEVVLALGDDLDGVFEVYGYLELAGRESPVLRHLELLVELDVEAVARHTLIPDYAVLYGTHRRVQKHIL
jgi:hypothetical protein